MTGTGAEGAARPLGAEGDDRLELEVAQHGGGDEHGAGVRRTREEEDALGRDLVAEPVRGLIEVDHVRLPAEQRPELRPELEARPVAEAAHPDVGSLHDAAAPRATEPKSTTKRASGKRRATSRRRSMGSWLTHSG